MTYTGLHVEEGHPGLDQPGQGSEERRVSNTKSFQTGKLELTLSQLKTCKRDGKRERMREEDDGESSFSKSKEK